MRIKRSGKNIFGMELTAAEKKALNLEIQRQLAEYDRKHTMEIDAIILWILHEHFGFGPKRLRRYYDEFGPAIRELVDRYECEDQDQIWLCTYKLKEYGIDLDKWKKGEK